MDTVILKIYGPKKFTFTKKDWFLPEIYSRKYHELSPTEQLSNRMYLRRFVLKAPHQSRYTPKIDVLETLDREHKTIVYVLIAEFSIPKLLYGNSLQEVSDKDFGKVVTVFRDVLLRVGIEVENEAIASARVSAVHFCKNVPLPRDIRLQDILAELGRIDIGKAFDVTAKETKNGGQILHLYCGTVERVFYDKVVDSMRPKVKRKDKGHIDYERTLIDEYNLEHTEIFRYEYRIKKTQTVQRDINSALDRKPLTYVAFRDLFTEGLSQKVLLKSWRDIVSRPENQLALIGPIDSFRLLQRIFECAKALGGAHSMNKALVAYGLTCIIRENGVKEFRRLIFSHWNGEHPERLNKKINQASELTKGLPYANGVAFVDKKIEKYELVTRSVLANCTR